MTMLTEPMAPWLREINRLFTPDHAVASFLPPADVVVHEDAVDVYMDVPGLNAESLEIELENDTLTVRGERRWPYGSQDGGMRRIERRFGRFERSLRVPSDLDADAVEASLNDGVLTLHIPMSKRAKPRRVEIKSGAASSNGAPQAEPAEPQGAGT
jgi:HSP20 family protein